MCVKLFDYRVWITNRHDAKVRKYATANGYILLKSGVMRA